MQVYLGANIMVWMDITPCFLLWTHNENYRGYKRWVLLLIGQESANFFNIHQRVTILNFAGHVVSVTTTQHGSCSMKAAKNDTK